MARINFVDVPDQKNFEPLPQGQYTAVISNLQKRQAGDNARNPGALNLRWEFEIVNNEEYENRKVFDNQTCVENSLWKVKALLNGLNFDTSTLIYDDEEQQFYFGEDEDSLEELDLDELVGSMVDIKVGVRPAGTDPNTGRAYDKQNRVNGFYVHETTDEELMA